MGLVNVSISSVVTLLPVIVVMVASVALAWVLAHGDDVKARRQRGE